MTGLHMHSGSESHDKHQELERWSRGVVVLCSPCLDGSVCIVTGQQWFVFHHQGTREGPAGE